MHVRPWVLAIAAGVATACTSTGTPPDGVAGASSQEAAAVALVDPEIPPAVAGESGWHYFQSAEADLTGDGQSERVVLTAQVEMVRGRPAWDDGQPWQVYVESADGNRTYVYAKRLQLGTLTLRLGLPEADAPASIVLVEHLPDQMALHEVTYSAPGETQTTTRFQRRLDPRGEIASPRLP